MSMKHLTNWMWLTTVCIAVGCGADSGGDNVLPIDGAGTSTWQPRETPTVGSGGGGSGNSFLPGEVYLIGKPAEGICGREAIISWSEPNIGSIGWLCDDSPGTGVIKPDGTFIYSDQNGFVRPFGCDNCAYTRDNRDIPVDSVKRSNDVPVIVGTGCPSPAYDVTPSGAVLSTCDSEWKNEANEVVYNPSGFVVDFGANGKALISGGSQIQDMETLESVSVTGLIGSVIATRAPSSGGFVVATREGLDEATTVRRLFDISEAGVATERVTYGAMPANTAFDDLAGGWALDDSGSLFEFVTDLRDGTDDAVIRYPVDGTPGTIVYTEADLPWIRLEGALFVTGP